jgi:prepilin-type N-terminal cleavage/methylation domain-containing protein
MKNIEPSNAKSVVFGGRADVMISSDLLATVENIKNSPRPLAGEGPGVRAADISVQLASQMKPTHRCAFAPLRETKNMNPQAGISRSGFTLIEMLIVITIMLLLTLAALVMLTPALENRKVREATRMVNSYLSSARSRAMETGRPCGVLFHGISSSTLAASTMDQCEVPEAFAGDSTTSSVTVIGSVSGTTATITATPSDSFNTTLIAIGDKIQFNGQGYLYTITDVTTSSMTATLNVSSGESIPWSSSTASASMPYCIYRSPVINAVATLQLPTGAVVDFTASGIGASNSTSFSPTTRTFTYSSGTTTSTFAAGQTITLGTSTTAYTIQKATDGGSTGKLTVTADATATDIVAGASITGSGGKTATIATVLNPDITVMFNETGAVDCVYIDNISTILTDPVFLLVGKRERMLNVNNTFIPSPTAVQQDLIVNVQDLSNYWVVINALTGHITSDVVASSSGQSTLAAAITASRVLAKDSQGMGGN